MILEIEDAANGRVLEEQAGALIEDFFASARRFDPRKIDGTYALARDGGIRRVLKPIALTDAVEHRAIEIGDVAHNARNARIGQRFDHDLVAEQIVREFADLTVAIAAAGGECERHGRDKRGIELHCQRNLLMDEPLLAARRRHVHAADGAIGERFEARAKEFSRAPARAGVELTCAFDETGAVKQPAKVLLVQF